MEFDVTPPGLRSWRAGSLEHVALAGISGRTREALLAALAVSGCPVLPVVRKHARKPK